MSERWFGFETEQTAQAFSVDATRRRITGLAVPYGVVATKNGQRYSFTAGSLRWSDTSRVKLLMQHDRSQAIGKAVELRDTPEGLYATFSVARGAEGDRALSLAEDGVMDGLSVGLADGAKFDNRDDVFVSVDAPLAEISLTPHPAFDDARVSSVAAEADQSEGSNTMTTETEAATVPPATFDAGPIADAIKAGFAGITGGGREIIPASARSGVQVVEAPLYRFDGGRGEHDFSSDLIAGAKGDGEAHQRVIDFMSLAFDVDKADGATLNPSPTRADMYVDQREYLYPLWNAVNKGTLTDSTPFIVPKFSASSGLVAAHTEGVEPTPGTFAATSQTITPTPVSGKVEITRELWDQGGNPQVSGIIWRQMTRAWFEALEAAVPTLLTAAAASITDIALTTGGGTTGQTLDSEITAAFASLQYVRGGFRFTDMATQIDLFKALAGAKDGNARRLYPIIGAQNAVGTAAPLYSSIDVAGVRAYPAWSLAATGSVSADSWLFDRDAVHGWASVPKRLEFEYRVAYIDLAIWGYKATAITDFAGVRQLTYDPV